MNLWKRWRERHRQQAIEDLQKEVGLRLHPGASAAETMAGFEQTLQPLLLQQIASNHENSGVRFVVDMLVASHPHPERLLRNWNANLPNVVDELHDNLPGTQGEVMRQTALDAWKGILKRYTGLIEHTVRARHAAGGMQADPAQGSVDQSHVVRFGQYLHAMQAMVDILIATHPDVQWLQRTWQLNLAPMSDAQARESAPFGQEALKPEMLDAWHQMTRHFTQVIEGAVRARQDTDNDGRG